MAHQPKEDGRIHGVLIAIRHPRDGRFLMIRRGRNVEFAPLKIAFPGGGIEPDETSEAAAVREAHEEVGLEITVDECLWDWLSPYRPLRLRGYVGVWSGNESDVQHAPDEVEETFWMTTKQIQKAVENKEALPGSELFAQQVDNKSPMAI